MMVKVIKENTELEVSDSIASDINKMLAEDPTLPIHLDKNILSFDEYTVGSIQVGELNLEIQPRNPVFTLEALFEMLLFESMNNFDENYLSSGFGDNNSFGIASITSQFFYECCKLVDFGLTGGFVENTRTGKEITGTIVFDQFHPAYIPLQGITYKTDDYSYDVLANQMIKSAIKKVMWSDKRPTQRKQYESLLKKFDQIQEFKGSLAQLDDIAKSFYSANPHYPLVLEFSIKILRDMKVKYTGGSLQWFAFLHNSNDIFEKYVRKVLSKGLSSYVTQWDKPKLIAVLSDGKRRGTKSYVPDVLVDYDESTNTAKAVIDVKNKKFETSNKDIGEILHSADMYQMAFYCDKMKTNLGGLIYPAGDDYAPIQVMIDGSRDFRFVLFSINMKEKINARHRKLCQAVKDHLLYYTT